ncbi:MAG: asparagine synthase (glutamine-hydrolyzing) [Myxococcota bacterium]
MCGIVGIFHPREPERPVDRARLHTMTQSLAHRGPDGAGLWTHAGIGLGHRRLAILDPSPRGHQPMLDGEGTRTLAVTYNGEIYNFHELRKCLESEGHRFHSDCDTEVLLRGYRSWGEAVVERISGIFAFALWDARERRLFLARDPLGVKPLFWSFDQGTFRFGSEIKAILSDPEVERDVDPEALDGFLTFNYTAAPATGFRRVRQLLPGECATVGAQGVRLRRFWRPRYAEVARPISFARAVEEFREVLDRVVERQLISDVPLGAFLSGGLDSAALVSAMRAARGHDVSTLTVGFDLPGFDERPLARQTATHLGLAQNVQTVTLEAARLLPQLSLHTEEPTADSSMLPVFALCREARSRFTVAVSGDGADEILAGYDTYRATALARLYRRLPPLVRRRLLSPLARALPVGAGKYSLHQVAVRFTEGADRGAGRDHASWRIIFNEALKRRLYAAGFAERLGDSDPLEDYASLPREVPEGRDPLLGLLHADMGFYLPNDMLTKVDRMSMANGLEVRVPFLDLEMVGLCADLPADFKLHRGRIRKHLLRESLRPSLPARVLSAPKSGFNIPVESWMRGPLRDLLLDAVATRRDDLSQFLRVGEIEAVADEHRTRRAEHAHALFGVLMLALWLDNRARAWRNPATHPRGSGGLPEGPR